MHLSQKLGLFFLVSEFLLTVTRRSRSKTGTRQDQSTLGVLWLVITASVVAGVYCARYCPAAKIPNGQVVALVGVVLFALGILLRWWAILVLGRFFTVDVTIERDHELVERGPFRVLRHPSYAGVLLAFVGFALSLLNWAALLVVLLPISAAFVHRMNVEEKALTDALGSTYTEYMSRTKRLVPFVY